MSTPDFARIVQSSAPELIHGLQNLVRQSAQGHAALQRYVADQLKQAGAEVSIVSYDVSGIRTGHEIGILAEAAREETYVVGTYGEGADGVGTLGNISVI